MKYNYEKMEIYADNFDNYVRDFQENCKNEYLKKTQIKVISQEQMRKNTGGNGLAYTDGQDIYIPELVRDQQIITTNLKDKNLQAKLIRAAFVLHELAHFEEDKPSSFLRTVYIDCATKVRKKYNYKDLINNKDNIIDKYNEEILQEVSEKFKLQYGKILSKENYNKYVGIYLSKDLKRKNTIFRFYNRWVDRYIENQLPLLAKDNEDFRNVKSILHFLRYNLAKKELENYIQYKDKYNIVDKLCLLTSNYIDPRTKELYEETNQFDKDNDWKIYYQINKEDIEKMADVNRKLYNTYYGAYNNYIRNEKDIYSVHFNASASNIYSRMLNDFLKQEENQEQENSQDNNQQQQNNQDNKQDNSQQQDNNQQQQDNQSSEQQDNNQDSNQQSEQQSNQDNNGNNQDSNQQSEQQSNQDNNGNNQDSNQQSEQQSNQNDNNQGNKQNGGQSNNGGNNQDSNQQDNEQSNGNSSSNDNADEQENEFSDEQVEKFKNSFKDELNKKTPEEMIREILDNFEEKDLREILEEKRKKEEEALNEQNRESFGKDAIPDQKGKGNSGKLRYGGDEKNKDNKEQPKFEDKEFFEFVNYKSNTKNDTTKELDINKPKVNDMIINFEKLINENHHIKELIKKTKELLKSSTTKEKKRMTSGNHKKIVNRAIRGDVKIFNKFVSFDLGELDIFLLIDNSGSMDERMKNTKIPFLRTRKDYSLFFRYLIKKIFEPLGANIDIKTFTTGNNRNAIESSVNRSYGINWENLQNIDDDNHTKRTNYDKIIQSKLNGAASGTNLFAAFNEYVPMIRKHQYKNKRPILLFTVSDGDTSYESEEERGHSIYLNNLLEKDETIKHIKLCIDSSSLMKYFGATVEKTRFIQSGSGKIISFKKNIKSNINGNLKAKGNTISIDNKVIGKSDDFSYIENFEDISKFMLDNLDSIFNIILNNGKQVISNHKGKTVNHNRKNLGPML